jgi:hypothetical protein
MLQKLKRRRLLAELRLCIKLGVCAAARARAVQRELLAMDPAPTLANKARRVIRDDRLERFVETVTP